MFAPCCYCYSCVHSRHPGIKSIGRIRQISSLSTGNHLMMKTDLQKSRLIKTTLGNHWYSSHCCSTGRPWSFWMLRSGEANYRCACFQVINPNSSVSTFSALLKSRKWLAAHTKTNLHHLQHLQHGHCDIWAVRAAGIHQDHVDLLKLGYLKTLFSVSLWFNQYLLVVQCVAFKHFFTTKYGIYSGLIGFFSLSLSPPLYTLLPPPGA